MVFLQFSKILALQIVFSKNILKLVNIKKGTYIFFRHSYNTSVTQTCYKAHQYYVIILLFKKMSGIYICSQKKHYITLFEGIKKDKIHYIKATQYIFLINIIFDRKQLCVIFFLRQLLVASINFIQRVTYFNWNSHYFSQIYLLLLFFL